ncbi:phosphodiester glycosidase family protein [Acinetobacter sp. TSRC1-2]|uniref:phosphodiester glycosidase family protein n=1 Tax=unclassified Acinetobacter TaxID=196816 RepID=UPI003CF18411
MKNQFFLKGAVIFALSLASISYAEVYSEHWQRGAFNVDVVKIGQPQNLRLFLNEAKTSQPLHKFDAVQKQLKSCEKLLFAMNAGMYHSDYSAVGLYVEASQQKQKLNRLKQGFGNFHIQPNGVLAWNQNKTLITTTDDYSKLKFNPDYATQSGPMLVINGKINPHFLEQSNSFKIRNGVGIKDQTLYFVISRTAVSFYQFAQFFKQELKVENALYLDGSISSAYIPQLKRKDSYFNLGPMLAYIDEQNCQKD